MASRKNRSRKANRKSPQLPPGLGERLRQRLEGLFAWFHARRWVAIVVGALLLFGGSLAGGYWLAERLEGTDSDRLARDTLEEMKRGSAPGSVTVGPKYARIEDLPDLPKYTEVEPGQLWEASRAVSGDDPSGLSGIPPYDEWLAVEWQHPDHALDLSVALLDGDTVASFVSTTADTDRGVVWSNLTGTRPE